MSSTVLTTAILATLLFVSSTMGHSQMRCAKYNPQTGECNAPIRNQGESYLEEAFDLTSGNGLCQKPMANPITAAYANGKSCGYANCPASMGTFTPGENFYVQWVARNHAVADQTPGNVTLYLSPVESVNQGSDVSASVFQNNKFCTAKFMSCQGQNGDLVPCYAPCTMPSNLQSGIYTIWWKWVWPGHTSVYSTCADIYVVASGSTPVPSQPIPAPATPSTTGRTISTPSTTGKAVNVMATTGRIASSPATTGRPNVAPTPTTPTTPSSTSAATPTPSTGTPAPGKTCNKLGQMVCTESGSNSFYTCSPATRTSNAWSSRQQCAGNLKCSQSGDYIYCL